MQASNSPQVISNQSNVGELLGLSLANKLYPPTPALSTHPTTEPVIPTPTTEPVIKPTINLPILPIKTNIEQPKPVMTTDTSSGILEPQSLVTPNT